MNKWRNRFLEMAAVVGGWSKDDSTKVGAVVTDSRNRVISLGFNGFPHGVCDDAVPRDEKLRRTVHAEVNAILTAGRDLEGCTIYVTAPPCAQCTAKLIQAGIKTVVCFEGRADFVARWAEDLASSEQMLREAGVTLSKVERP